MMRKKSVSMDGAEYAISPLTMGQVEEFFGAESKALVVDVVCAGLNNVHRDEDGNLPENAKLWTPERVKKVMDSRMFLELRQQILAMTELKETEVAPNRSGEAPAASEKNSATSDAA